MRQVAGAGAAGSERILVIVLIALVTVAAVQAYFDLPGEGGTPVGMPPRWTLDTPGAQADSAEQMVVPGAVVDQGQFEAAPAWLAALVGGWLFVLGACWGSFLNVVAYRLPRGVSLIQGGSSCPTCQQAIAPYDNVPILGWVWLGGRCRGCKGRVSIRYPLVELLTALTFTLLGVAVGLQPVAEWLVADLAGPVWPSVSWWLGGAVWSCLLISVGLMELDGVTASRLARGAIGATGLLAAALLCSANYAWLAVPPVPLVVWQILGAVVGAIAGRLMEVWRRRRGVDTGWSVPIWGVTGLVGGPIVIVAAAALSLVMICLARLWQRPSQRATPESSVFVPFVATLACWLWFGTQF